MIFKHAHAPILAEHNGVTRVRKPVAFRCAIRRYQEAAIRALTAKVQVRRLTGWTRVMRQVEFARRAATR
jgi:hypothetical protein